MDITFLSQVNYLAILTSAVVFFVIGSLWYSPLLMSTLWGEELKRNQVTPKMPMKHELWGKMLLTFIANIIASFAMAYLVIMTESTTWQAGLQLGVIVSIGFAATTLAANFVWQSRTFKLFLIDVGYPILGIVASAMILSIWL